MNGKELGGRLRRRRRRQARPRPRFELTLSAGVDEVLTRVREELDENPVVSGLVLDHGRIELTCNADEVRFWSPQLTIDTEAERDGEEETTHLYARFGPHPHVWTLYVCLYATSLAFAIGCAMYGISQWMADSDPWALWWIPASVVLGGLVYGASYVGQGLGSLQMSELRSFLDGALRDLPRASGG